MKHTIGFQLNGEPAELAVESHHTLLQVLQEQRGLFGAREACGVGACGSCTVLLDGRPVSSCLQLAVQVQGRTITTIEGIGSADHLHPLQEEFVQHGAVQCGYCTPGYILAAKAFLERSPLASDEELKAYLSGNLCRCTGYAKIVQAVVAARQRLAQSGDLAEQPPTP